MKVPKPQARHEGLDQVQGPIFVNRSGLRHGVGSSSSRYRNPSDTASEDEREEDRDEIAWSMVSDDDDWRAVT